MRLPRTSSLRRRATHVAAAATHAAGATRLTRAWSLAHKGYRGGGARNDNARTLEPLDAVMAGGRYGGRPHRPAGFRRAEDRCSIGPLAARVTLTERERAPLRAAHPAAGGYDFYLQGLGYLQNDRPESVDAAITVFKHALEVDPNYALAYAGLGEAYWRQYLATRDVKWADTARQTCERHWGWTRITPRFVPGPCCDGWGIREGHENSRCDGATTRQRGRDIGWPRNTGTRAKRQADRRSDAPLRASRVTGGIQPDRRFLYAIDVYRSPRRC